MTETDSSSETTLTIDRSAHRLAAEGPARLGQGTSFLHQVADSR